MGEQTVIKKLKGCLFLEKSLLKITGEDAFSYLQSQFSNDLKPLTTQESKYGFFLNHKGKIVADAFVYKKDNNTFYIYSYYCSLSSIKEKLEHNIIADEVEVSLIPVVILSIWGINASSQIVKKISSLKCNLLVSELIFWPGRRSLEDNYDIFLLGLNSDKMDVDFLDNSIDFQPEQALEKERLLACIPAIGKEIYPGEFPNEAGLHKAGVSLNKGCYLGQEVMSRLQFKGSPTKNLYKVLIRGKCNKLLPLEIIWESKVIGVLRSVIEIEAGLYRGMGLFKNRLVENLLKKPFVCQNDLSLTILEKI